MRRHRSLRTVIEQLLIRAVDRHCHGRRAKMALVE